jgi:hypothetical protein
MATLTGVSINLPDGGISNVDIAANANIEVTKLEQRVLAEYHVPWSAFRVWDAIQTNAVGTPATDDLALVQGTWGSAVNKLSAGDLKALGATTRRVYFAVAVPPNYDDGQTIKLRFRAKMETTVADTSCTIDAEAYIANDGTLTSDLVATSATSMNSLTVANYEFTLSSGSIDPGDLIEVRLSIACNDAASATAVTPVVYEVALVADTRG